MSGRSPTSIRVSHSQLVLSYVWTCLESITSQRVVDAVLSTRGHTGKGRHARSGADLIHTHLVLGSGQI